MRAEWPSASKRRRSEGADSPKRRQRPYKNALIRIWAAFSPDVHLSMKEGWGGGEKGFKLIFTTRKELVIHTIWAPTASEPPRPHRGCLGSGWGWILPPPPSPDLPPSQNFSLGFSQNNQGNVNPKCSAPSTCVLILPPLTVHKTATPLYFITSPPLPHPHVASFFLFIFFNPSERLFIKCHLN